VLIFVIVDSVCWYTVVDPAALKGISTVAIVHHQEEEGLQAPGSPLSVYAAYQICVSTRIFQHGSQSIAVTTE